MNIYLLRDPNTKEVKYIGKTIFELPKRLVGHLHSAYFRTRKQAVFKNEWIQGLLQHNQCPKIELIETVKETEAASREKYWIKYYEKDYRLYNIMYSDVNFIHREDLHKKVYQYDLQGNFIKGWESLYKVEKTLNIPTGNIIQSCKGKRKLGGKFIWRYYKIDKVNEYKKDIAKKPVYQYDLYGNFIKEHGSAREATKEGFNYKNISQCCIGDKKSHKNYQWKFDKLDKIPEYPGKSNYRVNFKSQDIVRTS